jgi:hypothetical protein
VYNQKKTKVNSVVSTMHIAETLISTRVDMKLYRVMYLVM